MKTNVVNVKKITAVAVAFLLMILSVSYSGSKSDAANTARTYRIFNAKTGVKIGSDYTLDALPAEDNSRTVIGEDERVIDWTKSGVVKIITSTSLSTGFVVSDHVIATAAHCVHGYNKVNPKPKKISKILLFDTNGNVTLEATPVTTHVPVEFINNVTENGYQAISDYALITVKEDLSAYACFNLGLPLDSFVNSNSVVTVTGFPGEFNTNITHMMYSGNGIMNGGDNSFIHYNADMTPGDSGGPVYITESAYGRTYYTVVGINVAYLDIANPEYNIGTRITTDLIHFYSGNNTNIKWE